MPEKLTAKDDTRTYSFFLINQDSAQVTIDMYNSIYILILKDHKWINHHSNKMNMAENLVTAVIKALSI